MVVGPNSLGTILACPKSGEANKYKTVRLCGNSELVTYIMNSIA